MSKLITISVEYLEHATEKQALDLEITFNTPIHAQKDFKCNHLLDFIIQFNQWLSDECIYVDDIKSICDYGGVIGVDHYYDVTLDGK